jgi:hypothetical protein
VRKQTKSSEFGAVVFDQSEEQKKPRRTPTSPRTKMDVQLGKVVNVGYTAQHYGSICFDLNHYWLAQTMWTENSIRTLEVA